MVTAEIAGDALPVALRRPGRPRLPAGMVRRGLDDPAAPFHDLLRGFRQRAGLSQSALARRANLDASYLNRLESGVRGAPTAMVVTALAAALGLASAEADRLLGSAGHPPAGLRRLGPGDATLAAVVRLLADDGLPAEARADFRTCVEALVRRWCVAG
jgi:transcriptional regulator with XRE-family HTH domain